MRPPASPGDPASPAAKLARHAEWAAMGMDGQPIARHRSLLRFEFPKRRLVSILLIPVMFDLLIWRLEPFYADLFARLFRSGLPLLGLSADITFTTTGAGMPGWIFPVVSMPSYLPGVATLGLSAAAIVAVLILSRYIPDRFLPGAYLLRFMAFIHSVSILYFALYPTRFPHDVPTHLASSFEAGIWLMMVLPWVLGLVYNVFDFSLWHKLTLPLVCTLFLALAIPFQLLTHAYILSQASLLFLPMLYLLFGILPLTLGCIGFYGLWMSWQGARENRV